MALTYRFNFPLPNGLHARPASHVAEIARRFASTITLRSERRAVDADAKSVLAMVAADVREGDPCLISVSGADEAAAHEALKAFIVNTLPGVDEPLAPPSTRAADVEIPRSLASAGLDRYVRGLSVSGGVATGVAIRVHGASLPDSISTQPVASAAAEVARFRNAAENVAARLAAEASQSRSGHESDVLDVHRSLLNDPELRAAVEARINAGPHSAGQAVLEAGRQFIASLQRSESAYLRERVLDLQDVVLRLLEALGHANRDGERVRLDRPSICVADHLTPGQLLSMDAALLRGLVLAQGGTTSHTVILARARGIPMLVDVGLNLPQIPAGQEIVVDGELGIVAPLSTPKVRRYYALETRRLEAMRTRNAASLALAATPLDGGAIEIGANISSAEEVVDVISRGADGVGLFRTEMLFLGRDRAPTEQEQYEIYTKALADAGAKPIIIRTFDIGGDKPAPYLKLPREANPFLGNRGVRLYASQAGLLRSQLRALLRAARHGQLKILVPMIAAVEEVRAFRAAMNAIRDELMSEGVEDVAIPPLGVMIEVPAAAMIVPQLAREVDFFSIGSNDLTQYLLAADRDNPDVASLYNTLHPSLWKLLAQICRDAREAGTWVGLCGELGENPEALPLLIGLGLDEISMAATRIAEVKRRVRSFERSACAALLDSVIGASTCDEVKSLLQAFRSKAVGGTMLERGLIELHAEAQTKEEAIKELTDRLWVHDRVGDARVAERAIWAREESYSTGFGYGCAIPHCKSATVLSSSVAVSKLSAPVMWNADGTNPVDLIIMLVLREQDHTKDHMRVLAQLSRMLMRDEFRDTIRQIADPGEMLSFLNQSLNL